MNKKEIFGLLNKPLEELISIAYKTKKQFIKNKVDLCSIINAKSGKCSSDCKFCAQSIHYNTNIATYPLKTKKEIFKAAVKAKQTGAKQFGIVTSGNCLNNKEISRIAETIHDITTLLKFNVCASLGKLNYDSLKTLKQAGLNKYHHNIETSSKHYKKIVSAHTFEERVQTIKLVKSLKLKICSGGIFGIGETPQDRLDMLLTLKELDVDSVPLNIFVPIKGTPIKKTCISIIDIIKTIAIYRIVLKNKTIKLAAGRESVLKDFQGLAFTAGANGMLIGGYLTIKGRNITEDLKFIKEIEKIQ